MLVCGLLRRCEKYKGIRCYLWYRLFVVFLNISTNIFKYDNNQDSVEIMLAKRCTFV